MWSGEVIMKISELQSGQGKVELEGEVSDKSEPRTFEKFGKEGKVCNAMLKDETGAIKLSLWNEQVDLVQNGNKIKISNGYVSEYQGEKQLSTGKFGQLEVLGSGDQGEHILTPDEETEAQSLNAELKEPSVEESVTKDEMESADMEAHQEVDIDEEKVM